MTKQTQPKRTKAPPMPSVADTMQAAATAEEQKAIAARAEVLNTLHDVEEEMEAFEDLVATREAEIETLQAALDKAEERRQRDSQQVAILRARCNAMTRTLDREHGNGMLQAAITQLIAQEQQLRVEAEVLEAQRVPIRNRDGDRVLVQPAEAGDGIEAIYIRMEPYTAAANELDRLTREPIGPAEIRRRIGEVFAGLGLQVAA